MSAITEREAATKRCQESYAACNGVSAGATCNPVPITSLNTESVAYTANYTGPLMCIGSACMAWRWHYHVARHLEKGIHDNSEGGPATGYCGKAGAI